MENTRKQGKHEEKNMGEILSRAEIFFEQHQKAIYYTLIAIVAIVVLIFVSKKYYFEPKNEEVSAKLVWCEQNLARDSFALALNGDGINSGYAEIYSSYKFTKAKNEAAIGAAICAFNLGKFDEAIDYAKKANRKSFNFAPAMDGLIGDCYVEKGNIKEAIVGNGGMLLLNGNEDEEWSAKTLDIASKQISSLDKIEAKLRNDYPLAVIYRPIPYMLYLRRDSQSDIFNRLEVYAKEMDLTFQQAHRKLYLFCKGIDKGKAVERYKKRMGVNIDIAAGDDIMDIPMLNLARFAFASEKIAPYVKNENLFVFEGELISDRICDELQRLHISGKI